MKLEIPNCNHTMNISIIVVDYQKVLPQNISCQHLVGGLSYPCQNPMGALPSPLWIHID